MFTYIAFHHNCEVDGTVISADLHCLSPRKLLLSIVINKMGLILSPVFKINRLK